MNANQIPAWFNNFIVQKIDCLYVLGLPNTPSAENLKKTTQVWMEIVWSAKAWEKDDLERLEESFSYVIQQSERFPIPSDILKNVPKKKPKEELLALPAPVSKLTDEQRELERQKLRNAVVEFSEKMNMENHLKQKAREKQQRDRVLKSDFEGLLAATKRDLTRLEMTFESCPSPCPHTASTCVFYHELMRVVSEMQAWEVPYSALTSPPIDAVPSDPQPTKKRRKKATV